MASTYLSNLILSGLFITSIPPLYQSITAAQLLLNYEDMTKKAAKWSNEAGRQLHKTRTTQTAAVVSTLTSTLSAAYLLYSALSGTDDRTKSSAVCGVNAVVCTLVYRYMKEFWGNAARVPLPGSREYNDAVRGTESVMVYLRGLGLGWGAFVLVKVGLRI